MNCDILLAYFSTLGFSKNFFPQLFSMNLLCVLLFFSANSQAYRFYGMCTVTKCIIDPTFIITRMYYYYYYYFYYCLHSASVNTLVLPETKCDEQGEQVGLIEVDY